MSRTKPSLIFTLYLTNVYSATSLISGAVSLRIDFVAGATVNYALDTAID